MAVLHAPSEKQMEEIMLQLGETENIFLENLEKFRMWMDDQPHIPKKSQSYRLLPLYLRGCKHNIMRAQEKLNEFFIARATCDIFYSKWDSSDEGTRAAMKFMEYAPLPFLTDEGYRIVVHRITEQDDANLRDIIRMLLMLADLRMEQEHAIAGDIFIFDVKHVNTSHFAKILNPLLKKALNLVQYAYPQRLKQIHVVNAPNYIYNMVAVFKGLMKKKMKDRFIIHTTYETISDYIPKKILPSDYNGGGESIAELNQHWTNKLINASTTFQVSYNNLLPTNQTIKSIPTDNFYGADGFFKTLAID